MISDRRPQRRGPTWAVSLLITLVAALTALPAHAAPVADSATVPTRIEGELRSVSGGSWLVDQTPVEVGPEVTLDEKRGQAVVGAWVSVWGEKASTRLVAEVVRVLRPAGAERPVVQFSGMLHKLIPEKSAVVGNQSIALTESTQIPAQLPISALVRVTGYRSSDVVTATRLELLALDPTVVPVTLEGMVEQITDATVVVDGRAVRVQASDAARLNQGDWVEIRAIEGQDGSLTAESLRVVDRSLDAKLDAYVQSIDGLGEDEQTWSVVTFESGRARVQRVKIAAETYVDEDRATIQAEVEANIDGRQQNPSEISADLVRLEQPTPAEVAGRLQASDGGGLWQVNGQPVWFASDGAQAQALSAQAAAAQLPGELAQVVVVQGVRLRSGVIVGKTVRPATSADLAAAHSQPLGADQAAAIAWVGPTNVVSQVTLSSTPILTHGPDGTAHIIFESAGSIYHVSQAPGKPWGQAHRIAKGAAPAAVFDTRRHLHVTYVNQFMGNYDIYHVEWVEGQWSLPVNMSTTSGGSADPTLAADATGGVHVAWMDSTSGPWAIHTGSWNGEFWTSNPVPNARGQSPSLVVLPEGRLFLAWQDRVPTGADTWGSYNIYGAEGSAGKWDLPVNISDNAAFSPGADSIGVSAVAGQDRNAHLAWIDDDQQLRYDFGRGLYWPAPVNLAERQTFATGLSLLLGQDNVLRAAWDDGQLARISFAPAGAQNWPTPELLPTLPGRASNVSLALVGQQLAVAWLQRADAGPVSIYEAHHGTREYLLKSYLPGIFNQ